MDLFEKWLRREEKSQLVKRALTDLSFKNVGQNNLVDKDANVELATYGDAVIKLCFCELMLDNVENITTEKEKYESDDYLARYVAKHYKMLDHLHFDKNDKQRFQDYGEGISDGKLPGSYKYLATAVEAMIGAIYKETKRIKPIIKLLDTWMRFKEEDK